MPLRSQFPIQEPQLRQLSLLDLGRVRLQLLHVPIDTQEAPPEEIRLGRVEPQRDPAGKGLLVFGKGGECVDDHASIGGLDDAGV